MSQVVNADVLDAALNLVKTSGTRLSVCSSQPTTYTQATNTYKLAIKTISASDYTGPADETLGRKLQINAASAVTIDTNGTATHIAVSDSAATRLLYVTTCTSQALVAAGTVDIPAWNISLVPGTLEQQYSLTVANATSGHAVSSPFVSTIIYAASASYADVSAAIALASSGDTVSIPTGNATWNSNLVITTGIYLIGAGIGQTNITSNYTGSGDRLNTSGFIISYEPATPALNEPFRLSGFTFNCAAKCYGIFLHISGATPITQVRVDHNRVYNVSTTGDGPRHTIALHGAIWGVADNNIFDSGYQSVDGYDPEWGVRAFYFGTADMWYFEDNTFIGGGSGLCIIRSADSARWCSRYNTYDATSCTGGLYPWHDAHGNQPNACLSVMGVEIYNNTLTIGSYGVDIFQQRGGKSLCYNNTVNGASSCDIEVEEEYLDSLNPPANSPSGQPQHISDSYFWNNLLNGVGNPIAVAVSGSPLWYSDLGRYVPLVNVDYWYQGTSFNGTTGVGVGLLSARPATCTTGVGYWATDESKFYKATATNTWTFYYTPYTYPHPLRS